MQCHCFINQAMALTSTKSLKLRNAMFGKRSQVARDDCLDTASMTIDSSHVCLMGGCRLLRSRCRSARDLAGLNKARQRK